MTNEPKLITDMNARERARFIDSFKNLQGIADDIIRALESGDDIQLAGPSLMFMLSFLQVKDLFDILAQAQMIDTSDLDRGVPPGFQAPDPED